MRWSPFRKTKAAIKLHTQIDIKCAIPTFIHISDGKYHEVNSLDIIQTEANAFYVMDKGYLDLVVIKKVLISNFGYNQ